MINKSDLTEFINSILDNKILMFRYGAGAVTTTYSKIKSLNAYMFTLNNAGQDIPTVPGTYYFGDISVYTAYNSGNAEIQVASVNLQLDLVMVAGIYQNPVMDFPALTNPVNINQNANYFPDIFFNFALAQGNSTIFFRGWKIELE